MRSEPSPLQSDKTAQAAPEADGLLYRLFFERAIDAVFISDLDDNILRVNTAACELYGYAHEELVGMSVSALQAPERRGKSGSVIKGEIDRYGGKPFEAIDIRKDGTRIDVEVTTTKISTTDGELSMSIVRDITSRKETEVALRDSERQLRQSQRIGQIGSWEVEAATGVTHWSEELFRQFERNSSQGVPTREEVFACYDNNGGETLRAAVHSAIDQRQRVELDLSFTMPSGSKGVHNVVLIPLIDHDGVVLKVVGTTQDVTDRKQASEAVRKLNAQLEARVKERTAELEQTSRRLESVLEASPAVTYTAAPTGELPTTYVSPNLMSIFGYRASRAMAHPFFLRTRIHPEDRKRVDDSIAVLRKTGRVILEYRFLGGGGHYVWVHDELRVTRRPDGRPVEIAGVLTDITQRKQAEHRLNLVQSAVEQVTDGVIITDVGDDELGGMIAYANPVVATMFGYEEDELMGIDPALFYGPATDPDGIAALQSAVTQCKPYDIELGLHHKDGTPFEAQLSITPMYEAGGELTHWLAVVRDITERKENAELVRLHEAELAHVTRLSTMGEMASGLAHELNQPLAAITNYGQGVLRRIERNEAGPDAIRPAVQRIVNQAVRAGEIIRRLRDFVTKRQTHRTKVSINDLVTEVIEMSRADTREKRATVRAHLAASLPELVLDPIQIEQVILNLIRNAIESMASSTEENARQVVISTSLEGDEVIVAVSDNGPGLTEEQLARLFDPFFTTKSEGMGMGLTISASIIESHGGRLRAANSPGGGAVLSIRLPVELPN